MKRVLLSIKIAFVFSIFTKPLYSEIIESTSDLIINEILAGNTSVNKDEFGDYDDWVELYNSGDNTINLNGYYLSDSKQSPAKYQITIDALLAPKSYMLIWTDGESEQGPLHTNFKLSKSGENLFLCDANLLILDSITYKQQSVNISYGRLQNDLSVWNYFKNPTPGMVNPESGYLNILENPTVNLSAGFYSSPICIEIVHSDKDAKIVYTLNGDIPNNNSNIYESCINIDKTTVVRFMAIKEGCIPSKEQTRSYFFNANYELDIVSIVAPGDGLEGSSGILNKEEKELEKPVHFEYFGNDKMLKFNLDGGLSIHSPKSNPQYSVRFYARSEYGTECINYPIFENKKITEYRRLVLRNSANDGTVNKKPYLIHFRDGFHQILFQKMGNPQACSSYKPVNLYVNGEYYGIYNLRERIDKYFIASNYGYEGDMDLLEIGYFHKDRKNIFEGSFDYYDSVNNILFKSTDNIKNYETLKNNIDIVKFIDYCILEIYIGNFDWILNNMKIFRPKAEDGKFEWLLWDTDHGSGLPYKDYGKVTWNTFDWALSTDQERTDEGDGLYNTFIRRLMAYEPARNQFVNRFADLMNTILGPNSTSFVIDSISSLIANDMKLHAARWNTSYSDWEDAVKYVKDFHNQRPDIVFNQIKRYYNFKQLNKITLKVNDQYAGKIKINTIIPEIENGNWTGTYFSDIPVTLQAIPNDGYHFVGWKTLSPSKQSIINVTFESDKTFEALFSVGTTNIDKINNKPIFYSVYPNPASNYIMVRNNSDMEFINGKTEILIFDLMGKKCMHETHYGGLDIRLDTKSLKSGLYVIRILQDNTLEFLGKISIAK